MKFDELRADPKIQDWLDAASVKPKSERIYLTAMERYTDWNGKSPSLLYEEAIQEIKAGLLLHERNIKRDINGFRRFLVNENLSQLSVKAYLSGVTNFYKSFGIDVPRQPRTEARAQPIYENTEIPGKEDLREVLKVCDPLEKAVVLVGISSGLSANEIINLKVKDFKNGYDEITGITTLKLRRQKTNFNFTTFLTPEASKAVLEYLNFRNRKSPGARVKDINSVARQNTINDNGYLFIVRRVPQIFTKTKNEELRKFESQSFFNLYWLLSEKAQKSTPKGKWNLIRSHNMRKYFNSIMLNAGCDSFHVEFFMGHTLDDTKAAYFRASPEKLREIYSRYTADLTIEETLDPTEHPVFIEMMKDKEAYARVAEQATRDRAAERTELAELRQEMERMKKENEEKSQIMDIFLKTIDTDILKKLIDLKNQKQ